MQGDPERIGTLPKITGLINGRAREQIQDLQILSLMFFSLGLAHGPKPRYFSAERALSWPCPGRSRTNRGAALKKALLSFGLQQTLNHVLKATIACGNLTHSYWALTPHSKLGIWVGLVSAFSITAVIQNIQIIIFSIRCSQEGAVRWGRGGSVC